MTDLMQQAREQFEAWATSQQLPIKRHRWGEYKVDDTETAWEAWQAALRAAPEARPLDEWHEDMGAVTWWRFPVEEAAWIGTPLDSDWPGYHTHWTPHPAIPAMLAARPQGVK